MTIIVIPRALKTLKLVPTQQSILSLDGPQLGAKVLVASLGGKSVSPFIQRLAFSVIPRGYLFAACSWPRKILKWYRNSLLNHVFQSYLLGTSILFNSLVELLSPLLGLHFTAEPHLQTQLDHTPNFSGVVQASRSESYSLSSSLITTAMAFGFCTCFLFLSEIHPQELCVVGPHCKILMQSTWLCCCYRWLEHMQPIHFFSAGLVTAPSIDINVSSWIGVQVLSPPRYQ